MDEFNKQPVQDDNPTSEPVTSPAPIAYEDQETYATPERAEPVAPLAIQKKKSHAGKWLLWGLVVLLLAGLGAFAYWQFTEAENARKEATSAAQELSTLKASQSVAKDTDKTEEVAPVLSDKDEVVIAAKAFLEVRKNNQFDTVDPSLVSFDNSKTYAKAVATVGTSTEGGYTIIAKKLKDNWVVIAGSTAFTTEQENALVKEFGVPATLLADS